MNYTGRTIITINGSTYPIKFGMGALIHFSETLGYDVQATIEELTKPGVNQIKAISKFIYSALYVESIFKDKELNLTFDDVIDWVDSTHPNVLSDVMKSILTGLSNITQIDYPESAKKESKKK